MLNGVISTRTIGTTTASGIYAGRYTDAELLGFKALPSVWSRKPTSSPEICFTGWPHIVPGQRAPQVDGGDWVAPAATVVEIPAGLSETYNTYGITKPAEGYELRFINSLGVHENIYVKGLSKREVNITHEMIAISRQETFSQFSRGMTIKENDYETLTLSSGPLDETWASYFIHEVLMARWMWIDLGPNANEPHYVPCHVLPEETVTLRDAEKAAMLEVTLKVRLDINGAPV